MATVDNNDQRTKYNLSAPVPSEYLRGLHLSLFKDINVWSPHSAPTLLRTLEESGIVEQVKGKNIIDVGTGSGILGIALKKLGAQYVLMLDKNPHAVGLAELNSKWNGLKEDVDFNVGLSDCLNEIDEGYKADIIIGNLPMQPLMPGIHDNNLAYKWNQNGNEGRDVLDRVISQARQHLTPGGLLIVTASSRQGEHQTFSMFRRYFGQNWQVINSDDTGFGIEEELDEDYHGPFIMHWVGKTMFDNQIRVYEKDENGNPYIHNRISAEKLIKFVTLEDKFGKRMIQVRENEDGIKCYKLTDDEPIFDPDIDLTLLPSIKPEDMGKWFHRYMVICAVNQ